MGSSTSRRIMNILIVAATFGSWLYMVGFGEGSLAQNGLGSLRYFTVLSNLFAGIMALAWLVNSRRGSDAESAEGGSVSGNAESVKAGSASVDAESVKAGDGSGAKISGAAERIERLKYIAAASVGLTFLTVVGFLGLIYGYKEMFAGPNLFLHLVGPLAAIAEVIFMSDYAYTRRDNMLVVIPPFLYGMGYVANVLINGIGEWPETNDWYFFFAWGYAMGAVIYAVLLTVTWLAGLLMRKLAAARRTAGTAEG